MRIQYKKSNRSRKRKHGFLARSRSHTKIKILKRRRQKNRWLLAM